MQIRIPVLTGRELHDLLERADKAVRRVKSCLEANLRYGQVGAGQELAGMLNSTGAQIIGEALSQFLREQCGQIRAADSDILSGGIQRKVAVGQVLLDIFACGLYILVAALTVLCVDAEKKLLQIGENLILLRDA